MTFAEAITELSNTIPLFDAPESANLRQALFMAIESLRGFAELEHSILEAGEHSILT